MVGIEGLWRCVVERWVFGQEVFEEGGFGRFDWFGFGLARAIGARFAGCFGSGWELEIGRKRERKKATEGAQDLAGELGGLRDQGYHVGV